MHDWALWRSKINDYLILNSMFETLNEFLNKQKNPSAAKFSQDEDNHLERLNSFKIEPCLARFIYYHGCKNVTRPRLDPDSFMFYGLPRVQLSSGIAKQTKSNISHTDKTSEKKTSHKVVKSFKERITAFENVTTSNGTKTSLVGEFKTKNLSQNESKFQVDMLQQKETGTFFF